MLKPASKTSTRTATPKPAEVDTAPAAPTSSPKAPEPTTDDQWAKPSEVQRDRVRTGATSGRKSELEKAREAFAKAETVGIDEEGSGVIETRMLRASEVRELLEGPGVIGGGDDSVPAPTMMEGSEPLPEGAEEFMTPKMPSGAEVESQILGSKSAYVSSDSTEEAVSPFAPSAGGEFSSSRYDSVESPPDIPTGKPSPTATPAASVDEAVEVPPRTDDMETVMECPNCGKLVSKDPFKYPNEVYSAMGAARLKQARFLVVQGKNEAAMKELRVARALYNKAGDTTGLDETSKLVDSLARS